MTFMLCLTCLLFACTLGAAKSASSTLVMQGPEYVLPKDKFELSCIRKGNHQIRTIVHNCLLISKSSQQVDGESRVNLHVAHDEKACKITCFSGTQTKTMEIPVIDVIIKPEPQNTEIFKGMPFTLTCKSRCTYGADVYQVVWKTIGNKTSMFVRNDEDHTVWSTPAYKDTLSHHLTVHSASRSGDYECAVIDVNGGVISSAEQYVDVKESDDSTVTSIIDYLKHYFKWAYSYVEH